MNHRVRKRTRKLNEDGAVDWTRLPGDIAVTVFTHLNYRDRAKLSSTCKIWRRHGTSSCLWESLDLRAHKCETGLMNKLSSRCSNLKRLTYHGSNTMDSLSNLKAKSLRELRADHCQFINDSNLAHIGANHVLLESIELGPDYCENITSEGIVAVALCCPKLKKLRLLGVPHVNTVAINALATHCPDLQEIGFIDCQTIEGVALKNVVSLRFLSVAGTRNLDWDLAGKSWCNLTHLEGLDVSRTNVVPEVVLGLIRSLKSLKLLCALECPSLEHAAALHTKAKHLGIMMLGYFNDTFIELSRMFPGNLSEWRNRSGKQDGILDELFTWVEWILSHVFLQIYGINPPGFNEFWVNQGIDLLLNLLQSSQEDVQEYAAIALAGFPVVDDYAANAEAIMNGGGVDLLLGLATSLNEGIQKEATKAIANLSENPAFAMSVVERGGITILASLTKSKHEWVVKEATVGLLNLSVYDEHKGAISESGAIKALVDLILKWRRVFTGALERSTSALAILATNDKCGMKMAAVGGINALVTLIRYCDRVEVRKEATRALANLSVHDTIQEHIALAGGVEALVALAKTCINVCPSLQERVADALWALSALEANSIAIGQQGGIAALIRLATVSQTEDVQSMAVGALWSLAFNPGNAMRIVAEDRGIMVLLRICSIGSKRARLMAGLAFAYMFDGRLEDYARVAECGSKTIDFVKSRRIPILKDIEHILKTFVDLHDFTAASLSSASAPLAQVAESARIVEVGQRQCKQAQIGRFVSMLRNKSPVLKSCAAIALFQFTVPGGQYARHHVNLLQELGASRVLRVTAAATAGPLEAKVFAKIVLRNLEHQQTSSA